MAPMYTQTRVMIALLAAILNVRVVSSATPMVAVRPGSIPMMMPSPVLHTTESSMSHLRKPSRASPNMRSPSMATSLGQIDEEQVLERGEHPGGSGDGDDGCEHGHLPLGRERLLDVPLARHNERER